MLKSKDARQQVDAQKEPQWLALRMAAVQRLPGASEWMRRWIDDEKLDNADTDDPDDTTPTPKGIDVRTYSDADQREFFECLFPKMGQHLETVWQGLARTPYRPSPYHAAFFRAPHRRIVVARQRHR